MTQIKDCDVMLQGSNIEKQQKTEQFCDEKQKLRFKP
jgi:hypothetical protein